MMKNERFRLPGRYRRMKETVGARLLLFMSSYNLVTYGLILGYNLFYYRGTTTRLFLEIALAAGIVLSVMSIARRNKSDREREVFYCASLLYCGMVVIPVSFYFRGGLFTCASMYFIMPMLYAAVYPKKKTRILLSFLVFLAVLVTVGVYCIRPDIFPTDTHEEDYIGYVGTIVCSVVSAAFLVSFQQDVYILENKRSRGEYALRSDIRAELLESEMESGEELKRLRHDMRHHDSVILEFAENDDREGLIRYLGEKKKRDEVYAKRIYCMNACLNNLLTIYVRRAERMGIRTEVKADVRNEDISISQPDLVVILGNILENAINGAANSGAEEPFIEFSAAVKSGKLVINCANSCEEGLEINYGRLPNPGLGLSSILQAVERNSGEIEFSRRDNTVYCLILLEAAGVPAGPQEE